MNIWSLDKHRNIRHILLILTNQLGESAFVIDTQSSADGQTVYLAHPQEPEMRIWLHTLGQSPNRYGLHLEYPNSMESYDNLTRQEVVAIAAGHFDVPIIQDRS